MNPIKLNTKSDTEPLNAESNIKLNTKFDAKPSTKSKELEQTRYNLQKQKASDLIKEKQAKII